jgi:hypothetical protein
MNARETERWARKRTIGRLRFILVYGVLLNGVLPLALFAAAMWFTSFFQLVFSRPLPVVGVFALYGAIVGLLILELFEFRFRRASRPLSADR